MSQRLRVIAVDGPAASGKGTLAKALADHFGMAYLDTGLLYRATAWRVLEAGGDPADSGAALAAAKNLTEEDFSAPELRSETVGKASSIVAAIPEVRKALLAYQRTFADRPEGAVLDGRDIGTVVCPDADVKLFVTAAPEERARRRHAQLRAYGDSTDYDTVLRDIRTRDERDMKRDASPLVQAEDAFTIDSTHMNAEETLATGMGIVQRQLAKQSYPKDELPDERGKGR